MATVATTTPILALDLLLMCPFLVLFCLLSFPVSGFPFQPPRFHYQNRHFMPRTSDRLSVPPSAQKREQNLP
jgi:hypothetical protein